MNTRILLCLTLVYTGFSNLQAQPDADLSISLTGWLHSAIESYPPSADTLFELPESSPFQVTQDSSYRLISRADEFWGWLIPYWFKRDSTTYSYRKNLQYSEFTEYDLTPDGYVPERTTRYQYDDNDSIIDIFYDLYDSQGVQPANWTKRFFDEKGKIEQELFTEWDGSEWQLTAQKSYEYDSIGNKVRYKERLWLGGGAGDYEYIYDWTYDEQNRQSSLKMQTVLFGDSLYRYQEIYTYQGVESRPDTVTAYAWKNENWELYDRNIYSYFGPMVETHAHQWWLNFGWKNDIKMIYEYDSDYRVISQIEQIQDSSSWQNESRKLIIWDGEFIGESLTHQWDGNDWVSMGRNTYFYEDDLITKKLTQYWNDSIWQNASRSLYEYDSLDNMIILLKQLSSPMGWTDSGRTFFEYEAYVPSTVSEGKAYVSISHNAFPNPTSGQVVIAFDNPQSENGWVLIFSLQGNLVSRQAISRSQSEIVWKPNDDVVNGTYFYQLKIGDRFGNGKIVLLK